MRWQAQLCDPLRPSFFLKALIHKSPRHKNRVYLLTNWPKPRFSAAKSGVAHEKESP